MKSLFLSLVLFAMCPFVAFAGEPDIRLSVNLNSHAKDIPATLYGVFFEEINHAGEGGLYGELLQNRSFEDKTFPYGYKVENGRLLAFETKNYNNGRVTTPSFPWTDDPYPGWTIEKTGNAVCNGVVTTEDPNFPAAPSSLRLDVKNIGGGVSLVNNGFWGIHITRGAEYRLRIWMKGDADGMMKVRLADSNGGEAGGCDIQLLADGKWHEYKSMITSTADADSSRFIIEIPKAGIYSFDYVSLFPVDTFHGRENGLRRDVAEMIDNLHPAFVRWPGGCVVEGITLNNRIDWKKTLGDPASRPGEFESWKYRNSYGFGYKEFLDFCEDLGAKAMFVCNVGMACTGQTGEYSAYGDIQTYIDDALEAIEYAIGDTTTVWGSLRARQGHPAPYPLAYLEVGNENFGAMYEGRYRLFHNAIKAHYPQITIISDYGMDTASKALAGDMIDPHWYVKPERFFNEADKFDTYDRNGPKVYIGEYACNDGVGSGSMFAALSEAAFLTGIERNADVVRMASYAPLFENKHDRSWPVNLIWISNDQVVGRSSYYVQKMYSDNRPSYNLETSADVKPETERQAFLDQSLYIGLGSCDTKAEFCNVILQHNGKSESIANPYDTAHWQTYKDEHIQAVIWRDSKVQEGDVVEFDAKSEGGVEQFRFFFDLKRFDLRESGRFVTFGGNNNTTTAVEGFWADTNRWIDVPAQQSSAITPDEWHHVCVMFLKDGLDVEVDGKTVLTHRTQIKNRKFYAAGYDEKTGEVVIKLVNANQRKCNAHIELTDGEVDSVGSVITLQAKSPNDENSYDNPCQIYPEKKSYKHFGKQFNYLMPANSVSILRIKKR